MAKTILQSFQEYKRNLEITSLQTEVVSTRHTNVRKILSDNLKVLDTFLTGSYSRSTMIAPLKEADIDIFAVLNPEYYEKDGQAKLLDIVKRSLKKAYPITSKISRNGQAITITFNDFLVDVVPSFYRKGGGYIIADTISMKWIGTDPRKHIEIMSKSNFEHNGDFVPLVKMIKGWNKNISYNFRSFHLEVMAYHILENVTISDYPSGIRYFFEKGIDYITKKNPDPAGYNDDVGSYINTKGKFESATTAFATALNRALRAEEYALRGYIEESINEWRKIFGSRFPAFG